MPKKIINTGHSVLIHPWEVFDIKGLADRLQCSDSTIKKFIRDGLGHRKVKSITMFTGQQILNYFNKESCAYTEQVVKKVFENNRRKVSLERMVK